MSPDSADRRDVVEGVFVLGFKTLGLLSMACFRKRLSARVAPSCRRVSFFASFSSIGAFAVERTTHCCAPVGAAF